LGLSKQTRKPTTYADKGWGDREAYNKLLVEEAKRARIRKYKKIASDVLIGAMFVGFVLALLFLTGCSVALPEPCIAKPRPNS
jgi:hypothetical protein